MADVRANRHVRILVVDDDVDSRRMIEACLQSQGFETFSVDRGDKALQVIDRFHPQLVVLDVQMPGMDGVETLSRLRMRSDYVACILLTANHFVEDIVEGLDRGADDYIVKPFAPEELLARVRSKLRIKELNDRLNVANKKLRQLAELDDLTGLYNTRSLYHRLDFEIERAERFDRHLCVMMMDMDHFKKANDHHDHLFGSFVLAQVGQLIRKNIRKVDFAARYGGDEFLLVLSEIDLVGSQIFAERIRKNIQQTCFANDQHQCHFTVSIGLMHIQPKAYEVDAKKMILFADRGLYRAKLNGRNRVEVYTPHPEELRLRHPRNKIQDSQLSEL